ncbi:MAG: hypothetical protein C0483_16360 [Pirellula sp.]|nr:hypothetical protein [Pirellula sp.]
MQQMNLWFPAAASVIAFAIALVSVPAVRKFALRIGLVDRPDQHRKIHARDVSLGGGVAIAITMGATAAIAFFFPSVTRDILSRNPRELVGILGGLAVAFCLGLWDDAFHIRARYKLIGQIVAAGIVAISGIVVDKVGLGVANWELGILSVPATIFWLVLCMNALNLIDGADGLAATISIILFATIAAIAFTLENEVTAFVALAMCGALLGFLYYNFPPASIFLGDCGSLTIGLLAGSLAIHSCTKGAAALAITAPMAMWIIPIMDVAMAVLRRRLTGRGLSTTDRLHLHHCLLNRGLTNKQLLGAAATIGCVSGFGAWLTIRFHNQWFAVLVGGAVVLFLVGSRLFGHVELRLAGHHLSSWRRSMFSRGASDERRGWGGQVHLQGTRPWEDLWSQLIDASDTLGVCRLRLDLNLPWLHEAFHATWQCPTSEAQNRLIHVQLPLQVGRRPIGVLTVAGHSGPENSAWLMKLADFLNDFQEQVQLIYERSQNPDSNDSSDSKALSITPASLPQATESTSAAQ